MAPRIPAAEIKLSFPLYSCDFDTQDANRLIVGGGGGANKSGVGNALAILDLAQPDAIQVLAQADLSRDEDSVTSLAVGPSSTVFAGINSSEADIKKGKNEHLRVFGLDQQPSSKIKPKGKAASGGGPKITELSRSSLFSSKDPDAYQRVLRLSPAFAGSSSPQLGAAATGLSKDPQIALFSIPPGSAAPIPRGVLELTKEAMDLDLIQTSSDAWQLVYCDDYEIYTLDIGTSTTSAEAPRLVFTMPHDSATGSPRPTFRAIRYLTPTFVLAVTNRPQSGGVILQGFRLPKEPGLEAKARLAVSAHLPSHVKRTTGMAVRNLSPRASAETKQGATQFVIAVPGQDSSVTVYTLDHQTQGDIALVNNLYPVKTLRNVHPSAISGVVFSQFTPPTPTTSTSTSTSTSTTERVQYIKLASIGSMGNTVVVHSIPLKKVVSNNTSKTQQQRYVVALKGTNPMTSGLLLFMAIGVLVMAIVGQGLLEIKGVSSRTVVGARYWTPASWHENWGRRYIHERGHGQKYETVPVMQTPSGADGAQAGSGGGGSGSRFLDEHLAGLGLELGLGSGERIVFLHTEGEGEGNGKEGGVRVEKHEEGKEGDETPKGRAWEELPDAQKEAWREKLKKAGHWGEEMGETIFKGVLFGEIGGLVGALVR
ncbi:hypothetical protein B0T19DRAFT_383060 [Cercophora scortea]|uniref:Guanine nucleotide-exchange factor SEC12 n=1 Tax=Cercophora scortea TaxID=314031 RepID=A0AAE0IZA3_9PEZI|nr:hypothetical protein B0T19DRAFT_383060 [Cercophora scortea]